MEEYPSSSTIPFPFPSGPYPQQAALMDAMLQSLEIMDKEANAEEEQGALEDDLCNDSSSHGYKRELKRKRANVMMLESPTGTGKSLSLACASLAWLRYREQMDLVLCKEEVKGGDDDDKSNRYHCTGNKKEEALSKSPLETTTKQQRSWLDDWVPPDQIQKREDYEQKKKECFQRAISSRQELQNELQHIRHKISTRYLAKETKEMKSTCSDKRKDGLMKRVREEIVKEAIENLKMNESLFYIGINNKHHHDRIKQKKESIIPQATIEKDNDFCLDEYKSDNENDNVRFSYSINAYNSFSDDDHDDYDGGHHKNDMKQTPKSKMPRSNHNHPISEKSPHRLLDGGRLDGSGISTYNRSGKNEAMKATMKDTYNFSIGNCEPGSGVRKIIYAARTHSQLSQFVSEVYRTAWGNDVRIVALGGRKMLCGNKEVTGRNKNRSEAVITEKCLDLQKGVGVVQSIDEHIDANNMNGMKKRKTVSKTKNACPLMSSRESVSTLALHMLSKPSDIEDLVLLGGSSQTCAYYASRESLKAAEVVVVPYNTLLSKPARRAVGLSLKSSLVIIDEAHNIPETLRSLSSCQMTLPILEGATSQLRAYVQRYASRLTGRNITYLTQIQKLLVAFTKHLKSKTATKSSGTKRGRQDSCSDLVTTTELLFKLKLDNINIFNILKYLERSRLSQKLHGFTSAVFGEQNTDIDDPNFISKHISCMSLVESFLQCLCGKDREGRVVIEIPNLDQSSTSDIRRSMQPYPCYRYLLLDPSIHFQSVINEAHAVVLAGKK